ncbi:MAG: ComF family protein [Alphaproteobacteria bacterium]|nr:ComF family protein [Alphaproteobacteria bacterium]
MEGRATSWISRARSAGRWTLDALLPPRCLACGLVVDDPGTLCASCWDKAGFIAPPHCRRCGLPFDLADAAAGLECASCVADRPAFDRARAAMRYGDGARALVLRFKHADATHAAPGVARWMARAGAELLADCDLIAPVPLHRWRLLWRRYNQSALLALELGRIAGRPVVADLLLRRRATPSQGRLDRARRRANVASAFAVRPRHLPGLKDRRVLLVDDVMTTGATVDECARTLKRAGAASVDVLTLARVAREL